MLRAVPFRELPWSLATLGVYSFSDDFPVRFTTTEDRTTDSTHFESSHENRFVIIFTQHSIMVLHLLLGWEFSVCKSAFLTILFWTLHFMPGTEKQIKYHSKALDAYLKRRMQAYPIFLQYCSLNIANKPEVQYDSLIMYSQLYHFLPQASLPLSQMYSTHLLITVINLLSADQNLILLYH